MQGPWLRDRRHADTILEGRLTFSRLAHAAPPRRAPPPARRAPGRPRPPAPAHANGPHLRLALHSLTQRLGSRLVTLGADAHAEYAVAALGLVLDEGLEALLVEKGQQIVRILLAGKAAELHHPGLALNRRCHCRGRTRRHRCRSSTRRRGGRTDGRRGRSRWCGRRGRRRCGLGRRCRRRGDRGRRLRRLIERCRAGGQLRFSLLAPLLERQFAGDKPLRRRRRHAAAMAPPVALMAEVERERNDDHHDRDQDRGTDQTLFELRAFHHHPACCRPAARGALHASRCCKAAATVWNEPNTTIRSPGAAAACAACNAAGTSAYACTGRSAATSCTTAARCSTGVPRSPLNPATCHSSTTTAMASTTAR